MENRAHALAAGLFAILLGAGVVFAIWWFSGQRVPMREIVLEARGDINGLGAQSRVRYRGMAVGSVRAVAIDPEDLRTLLVRIAVPADLPLTRGTTAALGDLTRFLTYHEHHGDRAAARELYAALPAEARDWSTADLEAATRACPNRLDFARLLPRVDRNLA